jgi:kumamolisin
MLDIEVAAAVAPKAKIVVYFTADTSERDFLDAVTTAIHDTVNNPSVISISWGGPEQAATDTFQAQFDQALQSAAALGITVTVASGDSGAADEGPNEWDGLAHADFPASSPYALACGGTRITIADGNITGESVWNQQAADTESDSFGASGGGTSAVFQVPPYQKDSNVPVNVSTGKPGRGVPDVAGDADPNTGYLVRVDGQEFSIGGTSAVAPLWAALIALCNQSLGHRAGFINPILYANPSALNDITSGDNRVGPDRVGFDAGPGWDPCTGLGSPNGQKILAVL